MAELVSIKRNVDVSPGQAAPAVFHCSQGDVGSKIILGLLNNGTAYAIPSGVTVTIEGSESNGSIFTPISATASGSDITFYLTGEMTAVAGPAICQAVLKSGSNILGTANFTLEVESSPMGADAPPVFTDAGWTWMLNKLTTEFVPALGNETIIDAIDSKADQSDLTALSNTVAGHTGSITVLNNTVNNLNRDVTENRQNIARKLDKNQGTANAGKYLKVGSDGNVENVDLIDNTLLVEGKAADAKATGVAISKKLNKYFGQAEIGKYLKVGTSGYVDSADLDVTTDKTLSIADKAADAKAVGDEITNLEADLSDSNERLDLVTSQHEPEIIQIVDRSKLSWTSMSSGYSGKLTDYIDLKGDGEYWQNPYGVSVNTRGAWRLLYAEFYDAHNNKLALTNVKTGATAGYLTLFYASKNDGHFTIENGRTLKYYYSGDTLTNTYTTEADIAKIKGNADFQYFDNDTTEFGITYGGKSSSYVPYNSRGYEWGYSEALKTQINSQIDTKLDDKFNTSSATQDNIGQAIIVQSVDDNGNATYKYGEAGSKITVPAYNTNSTYPVGSYVTHDNTMYKSVVPITTAEAWTAEHWTAITVSDLIADMNERLDMVVTMQEEEYEEPIEGIVQLVDLSDINWITVSNGYSARPKNLIDLKGDGEYWQNPYNVTITSSGTWRYQYAEFYDAYGNRLTLTNVATGKTQTNLTLFGYPNASNGHFVIENGRTLKYYLRGDTLTNTYTTEADIAKIGGNSADFRTFDDMTVRFGLTYGGKSSSYVPYEGKPEPTYKYNYVPQMANYVEEYMKAHGTAVNNNMFNYVHPETNDSEFVNAVKYYNQRSERQFDNVIRVANFNKYISRGSGNWRVIKQELADYSIDICGFEETAFITDGSGAITNRIENALQSWQFPYGSNHTVETGKALVSQWEVISTDVLPLIVTSDRGTNYAIRSKINLYPYKWYSNAVSNMCTLSVYVYHGIAYDATIDGTRYTNLQLHQMEINALLTELSNDSSDFKIIVSDTNAFEYGYDIATGTHAEWELFRNAGYTPVLEGYESTVTANLASKYFAKASNGKVYCLADYDQIFIGSNIEIVGSDVVDSNLYPVESAGGVPVSDHCMVYADLKFDFDAVMQEKLDAIAITEPWW